ncbi:MAG: riboflavin synthase [Pseudomonadota bacterium]
MFTGIITHIGIVQNLIYSSNQDLLITLNLPNQTNRNLEIGCSIACNGVCLTLVKQVVSRESLVVSLEFQASLETLSKTNIKHWQIGDKINLEFALRMGDELGGHLVAGHIDDVVLIKKIKPINNDSWQFIIELPQNLKKFIAPKGSVVLNGVSLTVNEVSADSFSVNIIKHTFDHTNFSELKVDDFINLEVDLIARYLEKLTTHN